MRSYLGYYLLEIALGGLTGGRKRSIKPVVTTNCKKSAEVIYHHGCKYGGKDRTDGMSVDELLSFLKDNQEQLLQEIRDGKYKPNPVRRMEISKETKGEFRNIGVPTVVDRVIKQAITQLLTPIYEDQFSENSFGFRPNRGAHEVLKQCQHPKGILVV